ncbi:MAG: penicillin-binding protein activator LpoB, partial [Sphingomonadaceae bacterium]
MKFRAFIAATTIAAMMSTSALAAEASSGRKAQEKGTAEIPVCAKRLGTAAVIEPDNNWWQSLGLGSPE